MLFGSKFFWFNIVTMQGSTDIKCVVVGDCGVGKTSLLITYTEGRFPKNYLPPVWDNLLTGENVIVENRLFNLDLRDTRKEEQYSCMRINHYPKTDIFLILFSIISPESLTNIVSKWHPKIRHQCPNAPIVVVGTKLDLRDNHDEIERLAWQSMKPVTYEQGLEMANNIGAVFYCECSSLTQKGVSCIFNEAIRYVTGTNAIVETMAKTQLSVCGVM